MVRSERQNREVAMRNIRIGVVEDDPASCQLVLDYLNRYQQENGEQFTVSVFDDGARIVEKYTPVYDILLLDIEMSEMDGMAAARRIRERDDQHRHGFGVKSIRHIAQQYGGEVTIRTEDHWFVLTALIPKKTGLMAI